MIFGRNVRSARIRHGWTQGELASRVAISVRYLSDIERGRAVVGLKLVEDFATVLRVTPAELLNNTSSTGLGE